MNSRKVGTYTSGGDAYDVRWTVSVLTAAGTVRSKSFSAPPPVMVKVEVGGGGGGYGTQLEKLGPPAGTGWIRSWRRRPRGAYSAPPGSGREASSGPLAVSNVTPVGPTARTRPS